MVEQNAEYEGRCLMGIYDQEENQPLWCSIKQETPYKWTRSV